MLPHVSRLRSLDVSHPYSLSPFTAYLTLEHQHLNQIHEDHIHPHYRFAIANAHRALNFRQYNLPSKLTLLNIRYIHTRRHNPSKCLSPPGPRLRFSHHIPPPGFHPRHVEEEEEAEEEEEEEEPESKPIQTTPALAHDQRPKATTVPIPFLAQPHSRKPTRSDIQDAGARIQRQIRPHVISTSNSTVVGGSDEPSSNELDFTQ